MITDICRIVSRLMDYPTEEVRDHLDDVDKFFMSSEEMDEDDRNTFREFIAYLKAFPTLRDWQEEYVRLFDTAINTNLYLFDFVYGSSKERGQAMVDLKDNYEEAGFKPTDNELPDYLPMYLEFASCSPSDDKAQKILKEINGVLERMTKNFEKINHPYTPIIKTICKLSK
jgi:nitrate reductase delta subunit